MGFFKIILFLFSLFLFLSLFLLLSLFLFHLAPYADFPLHPPPYLNFLPASIIFKTTPPSCYPTLALKLTQVILQTAPHLL